MQELLNINLFHFLMVFLRLGSALMLMPGFMSSYISANIRLSLGLAVSIILMPVISPYISNIPNNTAELLTLIIQEISVGVFLGAVMQFLYSSLSLSGAIAGQAIGFANAQMFDPNTQNQSIIIETFISLVAITVIFIMDIHHLMIKAIIDSYELFPLNQPLPWGDFAKQLTSNLNNAFIMGFKLGSPFIAFTLIFYCGMGLVSRLMPQLNIFFLSLPLQIYLGLGLLFITTPIIIMWFIRYYDNGLHQFLN